MRKKPASTVLNGVLPNLDPYRALESGGHGTRTRNSVKSTSFPMRPLAIRLPSRTSIVVPTPLVGLWVMGEEAQTGKVRASLVHDRRAANEFNELSVGLVSP